MRTSLLLTIALVGGLLLAAPGARACATPSPDYRDFSLATWIDDRIDTNIGQDRIAIDPGSGAWERIGQYAPHWTWPSMPNPLARSPDGNVSVVATYGDGAACHPFLGFRVAGVPDAPSWVDESWNGANARHGLVWGDQDQAFVWLAGEQLRWLSWIDPTVVHMVDLEAPEMFPGRSAKAVAVTDTTYALSARDDPWLRFMGDAQWTQEPLQRGPSVVDTHLRDAVSGHHFLAGSDWWGIMGDDGRGWRWVAYHESDVDWIAGFEEGIVVGSERVTRHVDWSGNIVRVDETPPAVRTVQRGDVVHLLHTGPYAVSRVDAFGEAPAFARLEPPFTGARGPGEPGQPLGPLPVAAKQTAPSTSSGAVCGEPHGPACPGAEEPQAEPHERHSPVPWSVAIVVLLAAASLATLRRR